MRSSLELLAAKISGFGEAAVEPIREFNQQRLKGRHEQVQDQVKKSFIRSHVQSSMPVPEHTE